MQIEYKNYSITGTRISKNIRAFPFEKAIEKILGKKKFVSVAFVSEVEMKKWNKAYRGKNKSTDILSFPNNEGGEILISLIDVRKKSGTWNMKPGSYLSYLFIHGLLHLKGMAHGSKMDRLEKKFCKFFKLNYTFNVPEDHSRNRRRHIRGASGRLQARKRE